MRRTTSRGRESRPKLWKDNEMETEELLEPFLMILWKEASMHPTYLFRQPVQARSSKRLSASSASLAMASFPFLDASTSTATPSKPPLTAVPTRLSPGSMFAYNSPPPLKSPSSSSAETKVLHRHSAAVERALHQLRTLSAQTEGLDLKGNGRARDEVRSTRRRWGGREV